MAPVAVLQEVEMVKHKSSSGGKAVFSESDVDAYVGSMDFSEKYGREVRSVLLKYRATTRRRGESDAEVVRRMGVKASRTDRTVRIIRRFLEWMLPSGAAGGGSPRRSKEEVAADLLHAFELVEILASELIVLYGCQQPPLTGRAFRLC